MSTNGVETRVARLALGGLDMAFKVKDLMISVVPAGPAPCAPGTLPCAQGPVICTHVSACVPCSIHPSCGCTALSCGCSVCTLHVSCGCSAIISACGVCTVHQTCLCTVRTCF